MATLPGRCTNELFCGLAASGTVLHVPAEGPYVCPNCGKVLEAPSARRRGRGRAMAWFSAGVGLVMIAAFCLGVLLGGRFLWPLTVRFAQRMHSAPVALGGGVLRIAPSRVAETTVFRGGEKGVCNHYGYQAILNDAVLVKGFEMHTLMCGYSLHLITFS